ncbi:MAG: SMC-Scp complex subunit ScpB [Betaproteobacteria bacterium]
MSNEQVNLNESPAASDNQSPPETAMITVDDDHGAAAPPQTIEIGDAKRALEAVLMAASEPMAVNELRRIFDGEVSGDTVRNLLEELRADWAGRSVELAVVASGYRFRVKPEFQKYLDKLSSEKPPRYSRAVLETLAIITYRQPVTRGDIEDIRGVQVSPHILKTLQDRGWIDEIGHKEVVGRPALFGTTRHFLDDLNLRSLEELPPLHELQATLDMTQAGAALAAGTALSLPGVGLPGVALPDAELGGSRDTAATDSVSTGGQPPGAAPTAIDTHSTLPADTPPQSPAGGSSSW